MSKMELLLLVLAIFGGIDLAWRGVQLVFSLFPRFLSLQSKMWRLLADSFTVPVFRRRAIATRVEEVLNQTAFKLQQYVPKGWIKRAKIRWVRDSKAAQLHDGNIVLRVRPGTNPDENLMQTLWIYFHSALFPDSRDILPDEMVSAVALAITRAGLEENHQYLLKEFDEVFLKSIAPGKQDTLDLFGDYVRLNEYGLFMGPFLREVDHAANKLRFSSERTKVRAAITGILNHMLGFGPLLPNKPDDEWIYQGSGASYAFMLVSKPADVRPGIEAYVKRAQTHVQRGIDRIYIIGRHAERDFVISVIKALLSIRELKGVELFSLFRDYRGDPEGVGALLAVDEMLAKLKLTQRPVESLRVQLASTSPGRELERSDESKELDTAAQPDLAKTTEDLIVQLSDYDRAWISLAEFGGVLRKQVPGFTPQSYGGRNLEAVLKRLGCLEFDERGAGPSRAVYVRLRTGEDTAAAHVAPDRESPIYARIVELVKEHAGEDGWIHLATLGHRLRAEFPEFDYAKFGASSLRDFVGRIPALEIEQRGESHPQTYVRVRR